MQARQRDLNQLTIHRDCGENYNELFGDKLLCMRQQIDEIMQTHILRTDTHTHKHTHAHFSRLLNSRPNNRRWVVICQPGLKWFGKSEKRIGKQQKQYCFNCQIHLPKIQIHIRVLWTKDTLLPKLGNLISVKYIVPSVLYRIISL